MKARSSILAMAFGTAALAALAANASSTFHPSNDESGSVMHVVPGQITRAERAALNLVEAQRIDPLWAYTGNEGGWELRAHSYEFHGGRVVHTDKLAHDTPRPAIESQPDLPTYRYPERGR